MMTLMKMMMLMKMIASIQELKVFIIANIVDQNILNYESFAKEVAVTVQLFIMYHI